MSEHTISITKHAMHDVFDRCGCAMDENPSVAIQPRFGKHRRSNPSVDEHTVVRFPIGQFALTAGLRSESMVGQPNPGTAAVE